MVSKISIVEVSSIKPNPRNSEVYDIIFDTNGKTSIIGCKKSLKKDGVYLLATFGLPKLFGFLWLKITSKIKLFFGTLEEKSEDLEAIVTLAEQGVIKVPIDKVFTFEHTSERI